MTKFTSIALFAFLSGVRAYDPIGMYVPATDVADHAQMDNDQSKFEVPLNTETDAGYAAAKAIYENGGHSKSIVTVTLDSPLTSTIAKKTKFSGSSYTGDLFVGEAYEEAESGSTELKLKYAPGTCQVGALAEVDRKSDGCLYFEGELNNGSSSFSYTLPSALEANTNKRTLQGFATAVGDKMLFCDNGCPEINASYFMDYYGVPNFGDEWVQAAFDRVPTNFNNGNANFATEYDSIGYVESIKKVVSYTISMLYALHEFEAGVAVCVEGEQYGNYDAVHKWDEGVAFYSGSQIGPDGTLADGKFSWALANKRCRNFATCGADSGELSGMSKINHEQLEHFKAGKEAILQGDCAAAEEAMLDISDLIYVPLIQGTLRYAFYVSQGEKGEKGQAEGAAFAVGVLPRVHAASPAAAQIIYNAMGANRNPDVDYKVVKEAFESVYEDMNIDCELVGGFLNDDKDYYTSPYPDTTPCVTKCNDNKKATVDLDGFGLDLTCKQLNNLEPEWRADICNNHGGAAVCPKTCGDKCLCTDNKNAKFEKNNAGKTMSCLQLSKKKNLKSICKKRTFAKIVCPRTCKQWCSWDDAFSLE